MANPIWQTASNLGTYNNGSTLNTLLVAAPISPAVGVTYEVVNGSLPVGVTLSEYGSLVGILTTEFANNQIMFDVKATDNLGNYAVRTFTLVITIIPSQPNWATSAGTIGTFPAGTVTEFQFNANAVAPATSVTYKLLSGTLPPGLILSSTGLLYGITSIVPSEETYYFAIRVTDNLQNIRDRSFSMVLTGSASPTFTVPSGSLMSVYDSIWTDFPVTYSNPISTNQVVVSVKQGILPPGLEINSLGVIRGYAQQPINSIALPTINTSVTETNSVGNVLTCLSTINFSIGRRIVFTGTPIGGIEEGVTYYVKSVVSPTTFTISTSENGPTFSVTTDSGFMVTTLPSTSVGQPTIKTYNFTLELQSINGNDSRNYSITVINQNTPISQGGPGLPPNTRIPTIYNTRPPTYNIPSTDPYYGYYLPVTSPTTPVDIGTYQSGNYFAFKMIGHDFDGNNIKYSFSGLPLGLVGDTNTGWISGTPILTTITLNQYNFSVSVYKENIPSIMSPYFNFSMKVANEVVGTVAWITDNDLGSIYNGVISTLFVNAVSDVDLQYRVVSGSLPPNLELLSNGQITGYVADQPTNSFLTVGDTTEFTFAIQAYSASYPAISSTKAFTLTVIQEFGQPTDILYMKCTPSIQDRLKIESLLTDTSIIPDELLYRPEDQYFSKATSVVYEHAYGIYASNLPKYLEAVTKNHYWRNITLGQLNTAVAKNDAGEVIYEVVYSEIIDDLTKPTYDVTIAEFLIPGQTYTIVYPGTTDFTKVGAANSKSGTVFIATGPTVGTGTVSTLVNTTSISPEIYWPYPIDLGLGPWYTSSTSIFTSYEDVQNQLYYTSLTPGYAQVLYPNSLQNMRNQVGQVLGQEYNSRLLPQWMTSQQADGSTTGFVPAWVICYTKPGMSQVVMNNIQTMWPYTLNQINFRIDRFSVDKSNTYDYDDNFSPPTWTSLPSATPVPDPLDSKDFYVLFPRQTILPDKTQY
jgi:hypothetical protein